jgi:hypothetical protein
MREVWGWTQRQYTYDDGTVVYTYDDGTVVYTWKCCDKILWLDSKSSKRQNESVNIWIWINKWIRTNNSTSPPHDFGSKIHLKSMREKRERGCDMRGV